jgi:two-component system, OmpR family, KDP operon response regulator KdpE
VSEGSVLVVDNDPQIRRMMRITLAGQGFKVDDASGGMEGLERLGGARYDLALLDINMPDMSGFEVCREIRAGSDVGVIMLTVRNGEKDKTEAFGAGADDFVTKPFSFPELVARMRAILKRRRPLREPQCPRLRFGDTEIDFEARQVYVNAQPERLTPKEWGVLHCLATHPNRTVTHRELLHDVWGSFAGDEKEYLRVFINRLRKKLERSPENPEFLLTEPWIGYRLRLPS